MTGADPVPGQSERSSGPGPEVFNLVTGPAFLLVGGWAMRVAPWPEDRQAALALGLPFRFLDAGLCPLWPVGTHGVWHLAKAGATAILLARLARPPAQPEGPACEGPGPRLNGAKPQGGPHGH